MKTVFIIYVLLSTRARDRRKGKVTLGSHFRALRVPRCFRPFEKATRGTLRDAECPRWHGRPTATSLAGTERRPSVFRVGMRDHVEPRRPPCLRLGDRSDAPRVCDAARGPR